MKKFLKKLDRLLTALSYAEAGDLDAVKELLDQNAAAAKENIPPVEAAPLRSAVILEFRHPEPSTLAKPSSAAKLGALP
jgi:hypothetical protein